MAYYNRNTGQKWLQEDYINLAELIAEGLSWKGVSYQMGRSITACKNKYGTLRIVKNFGADILASGAQITTEKLKGRN